MILSFYGAMWTTPYGILQVAALPFWVVRFQMTLMANVEFFDEKKVA